MSAFSAARGRALAGSRGRFIVESAARVWSNLLNFILLPVYLALIGSESFAVVSLYTCIQVVVALLDGSMAPSLTREIARTRGANADWTHAQDLARTLEVFYWGVAALIGIVIALLAPLIAGHWLKPQALSPNQISGALCIAAAALAAQWPSTLYAGGLVGLQAQVPLAALNTAFITARAGATLLFLWLVSPTMQTMFTVALVFNVCQLVAMRAMFWAQLPKGEGRPTAALGTLAPVWRFAAGVSVITITTTLLPQIDRVILSRFLSLEQFGYYAISIAIASSLYIVTGALFSISFPRMSALLAADDKDELLRMFRKFVQFVCITIIPVSAVMVAFSSELLRLWTHSDAVASHGGPLLSIYAIGSMINCLLSVPYTLMLSYGVTRSMVLVNLLLLALVPPLQWALFPYLSAYVGPASWVVVNAVLFSTAVVVIARKLGPSHSLRWMLPDLSLSLAGSFSAAYAVLHFLRPGDFSTAEVLVRMVSAWILAAVAVLVALPSVRGFLGHAIHGVVSGRAQPLKSVGIGRDR